ncbi:MAG: cell envelope integrity protein CreD, partial [Desulfoprunum sp.]|nr:cell envelope integrity protein CreD [Desulfoprunum sp.]
AGRKFECGPGLTTSDIAPSGVSVVIPLSPQEPGQDFAFELSLNGSEQMHFVPLAETTSVQLQSDWPSPSFNGAFLPTERKVGPQGFSARWNVLHLNRNYPQHWVGNQYKVESSSFGLNLLITADVYQKTTRIAKYAVMFIVFTFTAFFFTEVINRKRIHPVQYLLIGLAVILFYTSLLSLSEYLEFNRAYLLSAGIITLIITGYSSAIVRNRYFTMTIFSILLILYSYLFIVLQLEDYALLMGSAGLLAVLTTVMFITRKINWYELDMGANQ